MAAIRQLTHARHLRCLVRSRLATPSQHSLQGGSLQSGLLSRNDHNVFADLNGVASFSTTPLLSAKVRVDPARDGFAKARFTAADVPSLEFWAARARPPLVDDLLPGECLATAQEYAALALRAPANWRQHLTTKYNISSYTLHYLAYMMITGAPSPAAWHLATHILHTNVVLSYTPSVLTFVRLAFTRDKLGQPQFAAAEEAFERALARRDDPNACTLKGLIYAKKNRRETDAKALEWFRLARQLGGDEPRAWDWQASCIVGLAKIYMKQSKARQAKETFHYAAAVLDIPEACWFYAQALEKDDPDRAPWLKKAAVSGYLEAARELAQIELHALNDGSLSKGEMAERQALADEWSGIAGDKALY
ncbi:hypothetical protein SLS62_004513 [Diatrype stigma]|uniref:Uncharacterized protein n=1 Tax=Diatrype stigma TaxID=117547 RepID=A0AAN9YP51_9PEZI